MISLMLHEVRVRRKMIFWWTVGLAAFGVMYLGFYPSITDEFRDLDIESIDLYQAMGVSGMSTFEQYAESTVLNILPLLVGAFGIVLGTGALAGEEGAGTLELLASLPISRTRLYVGKTLALIVASFVVVVAVAAIITGLFLIIESDIDTAVTAGDLFGALLSLWLIALVFMALGLFLGALLPSRGSAAAVTAAVLVITFFANNLAAMVEALEPFQPLFPSYYYMNVAEMLTGDVPWKDVGVLLLMGVVPLVLGAFAFRRRDLMVGAWPWQRLRSGAGAPAAAAVGATGTAAPSGGRKLSWRVIVPIAVVALALCGCLTVSAIAVASSDDIRGDIEDMWPFGDVISGDGVLEVFDAAPEDERAVAESAGRVVSVPVSVDDPVAKGDVLVVLVDDTESAHGPEAQGVLEDAWVLLDEIAAGETDASSDDLEDARSDASDALLIATKGLRDAEAAGESAATIEELEVAAELARAGLRIASVRLVLADDDLTEDDVREVEEAMSLAQGNLRGAGVELRPSTIRSPVFGRIDEILVGEGDLVADGRTVVALSPSDRYVVAFRIPEDDADLLEAGQRVEVDLDGYDDPFDALVLEIVAYDGVDMNRDLEDEDEDADERPFLLHLVIVDPDELLDEGEKVDLRFEVD